MKIPKQIRILGKTYRIIYSDFIQQQHGALGTVEPSRCEIILQSSTDGYLVDPQTIEVSFLHEVVHATMAALGQDDLYSNEVFTTQMSESLYDIIEQIIKVNKK